MTLPKLMKPKAVALALNISEKTLQRMRQRNEIAHVLVGGSIRYTEEAVRDLLRRGGVEEYSTTKTEYKVPGSTISHLADFSEHYNQPDDDDFEVA